MITEFPTMGYCLYDDIILSYLKDMRCKHRHNHLNKGCVILWDGKCYLFLNEIPHGTI